MKHAVIVAHPSVQSFNLTMARAYESAARALGQTVIVRDLYRLGFHPCLAADELPSADGFHPGADVVSERALLADVDVFCFVYPLWLELAARDPEGLPRARVRLWLRLRARADGEHAAA